ncbi:MAG: SpoIID/LytB domain-containing protein [Planctomycetota bacterium]
MEVQAPPPQPDDQPSSQGDAPEAPSPNEAALTTGQKIGIGSALAVLAVGGLLFALSCAFRGRPVPEVPPLPVAPPAVREPEEVKVVLVRDQSVQVTAPGGLWHTGRESGGPPVDAGEPPWTVATAGKSLALNGNPNGASALSFRPPDGTFGLNGTLYRGRLVLGHLEDGRLEAVNLVDPEDYLRSVVGSEMYASWPLNALMAQAVAARTYMLYTASTRGFLNKLDLAYRGVAGEHRDPTLAVGLTRGIVMTYNGRLFSAYFHSTCGGHTASAKKVFGVAPLPPLTGVACRWCTDSPHYEWRVELSAGQIAESLRDWAVHEVESVEPEGAGPDGYARTVVVNGQTRIPANDFRLAVGAGKLKSTRFLVVPLEEGFLFSGRGYGHGVGLCQWGAHGLAREGRGWQGILEHYYPGAELQEVERQSPEMAAGR